MQGDVESGVTADACVDFFFGAGVRPGDASDRCGLRETDLKPFGEVFVPGVRGCLQYFALTHPIQYITHGNLSTLSEILACA